MFFLSGNRNRLDTRVEIKIDLISVNLFEINVVLMCRMEIEWI